MPDSERRTLDKASRAASTLERASSTKVKDFVPARSSTMASNRESTSSSAAVAAAIVGVGVGAGEDATTDDAAADEIADAGDFHVVEAMGSAGNEDSARL
mmetsp:Transcript_54333/g.142002  ORF Transcript_54333/g.142002 Transcript_54333/m.142002 type:complete len:100 (-) Transcript_54333:3152-3451(-)